MVYVTFRVFVGIKHRCHVRVRVPRGVVTMHNIEVGFVSHLCSHTGIPRIVGGGRFHHHYADFYIMTSLCGRNPHGVNENPAVLSVKLRGYVFRLPVPVE